MALICATIAKKDVPSAVKAAKGLSCDVVEVRLDHFTSASDLVGLSKIRQKVMATCMPVREGGRFRGSEKERVGLLLKSLKYADYVSVELKTNRKLRDELVSEAKRLGVLVIVTYHDTEKTPSKKEIIRLLKAEEAAGADIAKVAFKPRGMDDVVRVLEAQVSAPLKVPIIALSMGKMGRLSRAASPMLGGCLMFAAPSLAERADPGQFTIEEMQEIRRLMW
jgi:3-dehydroquinate dehydratase type I